ncbi:MAG: zinc ribbon domain-containing protein [Lactococcus garvieae]
MKKNKFCQSCAMPLTLHGEDMRGTEKDRFKSAKFCKYCYQNGAYTAPNITFEGMLEIGKKAISDGKGNSIIKAFMKWGYPYQLKKVKRWKK